MTHWVKNSRTLQEMQAWSLGQEDPLEKEVATHSDNLAWKIPWTGEPGQLQPTESQRVRHNWGTKQSKKKKYSEKFPYTFL